MDGQMKKGVLEMCILFVVSEEETYGYEILKRIKGAFPTVSESTIYAVLRRLNSEGCTEFSIRPSENGSGPARKYYRITKSGEHYLQECIGNWRELNRAVVLVGIEEVVGGTGK